MSKHESRQWKQRLFYRLEALANKLRDKTDNYRRKLAEKDDCEHDYEYPNELCRFVGEADRYCSGSQSMGWIVQDMAKEMPRTLKTWFWLSVSPSL